MQKQVKNQDLKYQNIYLDKHNRYIYFDKKNKTGIIIPEIDLRRWQIYKMRYLIPILVGYLVYNIFSFPIWIAVISAIVLLIFLEFSYRKMIKDYVIINNYQPEEEFNRQAEIAKEERWKVILRAILYLTLAVLLIVFIFVEERELITIDNAIIVVVALYCFYNFFLNFKTILSSSEKK